MLELEQKGILLRNPQPQGRKLQTFHEELARHCREITGIEGLTNLKPEDIYPYEFAVIWGGDGTFRTFNRLYFQAYKQVETENQKTPVVVLEDLGTTNTGMLMAIKQILSEQSIPIPSDLQAIIPPDQYQATQLFPVFLNNQAICYLAGIGPVEIWSQEYVDNVKKQGGDPRILYQRGGINSLKKLSALKKPEDLPKPVNIWWQNKEQIRYLNSQSSYAMCLGIGGEILANFPFVRPLNPQKIRFVAVKAPNRYLAALRCLLVLGFASLGYGGPDLAQKLGLLYVRDVDKLHLQPEKPQKKEAAVIIIDGDLHSEEELKILYPSPNSPDNEIVLQKGNVPLTCIVPRHYVEMHRKKLQKREGTIYSIFSS